MKAKPAAGARAGAKAAKAPSPPRRNPMEDPFKRLGLHGLAGIAPVLLAALASEEPLLLIGPHGTAKSLLLTRVAEALGLEFRHYNASLLNFDDLVGFPLPGRDGGLEYARTPAAIWGAGAVVFDEISRCRPDIQNKLFPIIHERKAQGLPLEGLRYRWAAMNPPSTETDDNGYAGSEPLDAALADRFAFVVEMPGWATFSVDEQLAVIRAADGPLPAEGARCLADALARARALRPLLEAERAAGIASYVQGLAALLAQADIPLSPRRAGMLYRSVLAVQAAAQALDPLAAAADAALLALRHGLPQRAQGIELPEVKILGAHREAWRLAGVSEDDPLKAILRAVDPAERLRLAVAAETLDNAEFSRVAADVLAQLAPGARDAAVVHLFESGAAGRLNAAVAEQAALVYRDIAAPPGYSETVHSSSERFKTWRRVLQLLSRLDPAQARDNLRANAVVAAFQRKELAEPEDVDRAFAAYAEMEARLGVA
ncbi:MAG TPA: MoxR family ATPase [Candidatus Desulfobacillus sp.]|nr:MoxR family ATPase [Candidatus Desulfobacillus sp.]